MAGTMKRVTGLLALLTAGLWAIYAVRGSSTLLTLAITASTFLYHFGMRLLVGTSVHALLHNHVNYHAFWFRPRAWEAPLYRAVQIKRWKGRMPTMVPVLFDLGTHSLDEIAQAMCQAEVVHEIIAMLSFLPLFAARFVGAFPVFLVTSCLAAAIDLSFAMIQRYNRPRILKLLNRKYDKRQR